MLCKVNDRRNGAEAAYPLSSSFLFVVTLGSLYPTQAASQAMREPTLASQKEDETIIVTGRLNNDNSIREQARSFINKVASTTDEGQYARWKDPVCVKVVGIEDSHAKTVKSKIYDVSRLVGAPATKINCRPNVVIVFNDDARSLVAAVERKDPGVFRYIRAQERHNLRDGLSAVRWWYGTLAEGADGHQIISESAALINNISIPRPPDAKYLDSYGASLIGTKIRVNLQSIVIIVDVPKSTGFKLKAIAAYISFIALSQTKVSPDIGETPSILRLFSKPPTDLTLPIDITDWDLAYLSSLYKISASQPARVQSVKIAGEMSIRLRQ